MPHLHLKPIDENNWKECTALQVQKDQESYLPSNAYSIAESKYEPQMELFGIYADDLMIGFAACQLDDAGDLNLTRFMIDHRHQGQGHGKAALTLILAQLSTRYAAHPLWLSLHPDNKSAIHLYRSAGFTITETGLESAEEIFLKLDLEQLDTSCEKSSQ